MVMHSDVSGFSVGNEQIKVIVKGDLQIITEWLAHHGEMVDKNPGVWPINFHCWASSRAKDVEIKAIWRGWRKIHQWAACAFLLRAYRHDLERGMDVGFYIS